MTNLLKLGKKIFTVGVVATTIFWSLGVAALVPAVANAATETDCATLMAGDLVKTSVSPVIYAVNADKTKSYFPQGDVFKSWTADNKYTYKLISQECLSSLKSSTAILPRPGTYLVKEAASDKVYTVLPGNKLAELSAEAAKALYGDKFLMMPAKGGKTVTMDDPSWTFYSQLQVGGFGAKLTEAMPTEGSLVKVGTTYYVVGAAKSLQEVSATGLTANRFQTKFAHVLAKTDGFTMGAKVEAEVATLVDRTQGAKGAVVGGTTPVAPVGALTVSLSADTAVATTLSNNTVYNNVLTIKLAAGADGATVSGLTVKKAGLIANSSISGVSVWVDGYRKGDVMSSFNSDNKVTIGFGSSAIVIPANGFKLVSVALNLGDAASSGTVAAQIAAATDIDTKASVGGTFPITGNTFGLTSGSATLASVKVEGQSVGGQSAEPVSGDSGQMEIGQTKEVAKFKLTESGTNDALVEKLIFYVEGSVKEKDLQNFELYASDNSLLGSAASISDRYLTIKLTTPYKIPKGTNRTLTLKTTAMDGSGNWFRVQLQSESDLMVKDGGNTFYILPYITAVGTTWSAVVPTTGYFKLKSGALTITKSISSPLTNLAAGATNVLLGKFDVKAVGEAVEMRKLYVSVVTSTATASKLTGNLKVVVDGATILTQAASAAGLYAGMSGPTQYTLSQYVNIKSGETKVFEVYGDLATSPVAGSQYQVEIGKSYLKRLSSLDYVDNQPNQYYTANNLSLGNNTPSVAKDTSLGNRTLSPGGNAQILGRWIVKAPEAEDIDVTAASINFQSGGLTVANDLQNLMFYSGDTQIGSTVSVAASSSNSFTFTLNVPKNTTKVLTLKGLVVSTAPTGKTLAATTTLSYIGKTTNTTADATAVLGQSNTVNSATVAMTAASDASTVSKVLLPSASEVQLGKWKVTVTNQDVVYNKLRLYLADTTTTLDTTAGNFGSLSLYEEGKETTPLATGSYLPGAGNGYVEFTGMNWTVLAESVKYLVLKGPVNGSGTMDAASYNAWAVGASSTTNMDVLAGGSNISTNVSVTNPTSTFYLFHNASPKIVKNNVGTSLALNTQAPIFSYTVYNNGDRELTLATSSVYVSVSGLTNSTAGTATGTISAFKLWNSDASGVLGTNLASASTAFGSMCLAGAIDVTAGCAASNATTTVFGSFSETVTVPAGGSRSFTVTANTTDVLDGKTQGTVSVSAMLDGATGHSPATPTTGQAETTWAAGKLLYFYTPVGGLVNGTAYGASDSYDVVGDTLTRSA